MERWQITRTLYKVSDFISWQRNGLLELSPSFQRRPVWPPSAKSLLIDTIVKGFPIPIIFVREQTDLQTFAPKRQIVDGQQRIRTVISYIDPKILPDYKESRDHFQVRKIHNPKLSGSDFRELSNEIRETILNYQFSTHVLPSDVDDKKVLQIFARMNSTGVKLNAQELRNATFFGVFKQKMYSLAYEQLGRWRKWGIFTENDIARMIEVETTSDLVLLMMKGLSTKSKESLDNLYKNYEEKFTEAQIIENRFQNVMDSIDDALGKDLPDSNFSIKTLFYYLFALVYDFHYLIGSRLKQSPKKPLPRNFVNGIHYLNDLIEEGKVPENISELSTRRTSYEARKLVFKFFKERIMKKQ